MVNHENYGGGGIYNLFNTFTSDNQWSEYVFVHEFGHGFAGLADEYYSSSTAYTDFYPEGYEPAERNITRMTRGQAKWADLDCDSIAWRLVEVLAPRIRYRSAALVLHPLHRAGCYPVIRVDPQRSTDTPNQINT